jgi:haloalkane dehalogenase
MVEAVDRFHAERAGGPVALCVHDWGGLIGLRWACDHPEKVRALVISATGFFPDGKWHGLAQAMRTEGQGEEVVDGATRETFGQMLAAVAPGIGEQALDEYFKAYADPVRRRGQLELYRSGDFSELEPYRGRLAALGVPTLLLFGSEDPFVPVASAHRLAREIPHARLEVLDGVGHFLFDDVPERAAAIVVEFLGAVIRPPAPG